MNREFKFRAWHTIEKRMGYLDYFGNDHWYASRAREGGRALWDNNNSWTDRNQKYLEIMQFTGLKDKNRKDIYEGDIVEQHGTLSHIGWYSEKCGFHMYLTSDKENPWLELANYRKIVIVGNIYENPELL